MRRFALFCALLAVGVLLAACNRSEEVIPTVAQLPSVTPDPNAAPGGEVFVTNTPEGEAQPLSGEAVEIPAEDSSAPPGFASPTPETLAEVVAEGMGGGSGGECSQAEMDARLATIDRAAVQADLGAFMSQLTGAAGTLGDWTINPAPDPSLQARLSGDLPEALLVYQRANGQQVPLVITRFPPELRDFVSACMAEADFFRELDMPSEVTVSVEPLALGDGAVRVTITQPASPDLVEAGFPEELSLTAVMVQVSTTFIQYIEVPALPGMQGGPPVSTDEVVALMTLLVGVVQGL